MLLKFEIIQHDNAYKSQRCYFENSDTTHLEITSILNSHYFNPNYQLKSKIYKINFSN